MCFFLVYFFYLYLLRIGQTQGQLVAVYPDFDRVSHRRVFNYRHFRLRDDAHVQKVLAQRALAAYRTDRRRLTDRQILQCHMHSS